MKQVPTYGIIGNGRMARHPSHCFNKYLTTLHFPKALCSALLHFGNVRLIDNFKLQNSTHN